MRKTKFTWKKKLATTLSLVMLIGLFPAIHKPLTVEAATSDSPSTTFATKDELIANDFNLNGGTIQNVTFGLKTNQKWYIAGYDENADNLVLMCDPDMPLISNLTFSYAYPNPTFSVSDNQGLSLDTCTYTDETPSIIGMNHYGLSQLRAELKKKETDTTLFTNAEQNLMEDTTIYNYDKKNNCYYSTTDKLYAAQAYQDSTNGSYYLVVGKNSRIFPNKGLKIPLDNDSQNPYYSNSYPFWLRTPGTTDNTTAAYKESYRSDFSYCNSSYSTSYAAVPAFAFDMSTVLFASAVPVKTATDESQYFNDNSSFIFRLDDNNYENINSIIDYTETGIQVTKSEDDVTALYLCAQGQDTDGDWYYTHRILETETIDYDTIHTGATESTCKIWLETTKDNVTYAQMAETVGTPKVSILGGTYTENQNVSLSTRTKDATIYYTTDGSEPDEDSFVYTEPISVTGKIGESITTTIKTITITDDGERSRVATYTYIIKLSHKHSFHQAWTSDSSAHWHECTASNCTITSNNQKSEYAVHTSDGGTVTKEPTTTATGVKTYKCSVCGYVMGTETISAIAATPAAKNTTLTVTSENCKVKVTSNSATNPTVAYIGSTNTKATTIKIPDTVTVDDVVYKVTSIAANAFANNKKITKVTIGKNVTSIGKNAFKNCKKLKTVSMGANVTTINDSAFYKCIALTKITIPAKVNKIGKQAFYGCKKLKTITIKTTKLTSKKVGSKAFKGIYSKATIKVPGKKLSSYKKMLKAKGVSSKAKIKK